MYSWRQCTEVLVILIKCSMSRNCSCTELPLKAKVFFTPLLEQRRYHELISGFRGVKRHKGVGVRLLVPPSKSYIDMQLHLHWIICLVGNIMMHAFQFSSTLQKVYPWSG